MTPADRLLQAARDNGGFIRAADLDPELLRRLALANLIADQRRVIARARNRITPAGAVPLVPVDDLEAVVDALDRLVDAAVTTTASNYTHEFDAAGRLVHCSEAVEWLHAGNPGWPTGFGECPHGVLDKDWAPDSEAAIHHDLGTVTAALAELETVTPADLFRRFVHAGARGEHHPLLDPWNLGYHGFTWAEVQELYRIAVFPGYELRPEDEARVAFGRQVRAEEDE